MIFPSIQVFLGGMKNPPARGLSGLPADQALARSRANGILASLRGLRQSHSFDQGKQVILKLLLWLWKYGTPFSDTTERERG